MTDREVMRLALEALEAKGDAWIVLERKAREALRQALEQPDDAAWARHLKEPMSEKRVHESDTMERHVSYVCPQCHWTLEQQYDQTALELCDVCGWKTLIPDDGCLNCERNKPWIGLTDEEIDYIWGVTKPDYEDLFNFPRAIETKLREKNGY